MKIANWNVERILPSQRRLGAVREQMSIVNADVWILTETHESVVPGDSLAGVLSGETDRHSAEGERWVGIWSIHPLESLEHFVSDVVRCAAARISHPVTGEVIVFGCVLPWGGSVWRGISSRDGAFAAALELYLGDWTRLRSAYPDAVFVAAGDFNQDLASHHYYGSREQRRMLESALKAAGLVAVTAGDGDPIARTSPSYACIDHICVSVDPTLKVGATSRWPDLPAPDKRLSDHFGVAVEVWRI